MHSLSVIRRRETCVAINGKIEKVYGTFKACSAVKCCEYSVENNKKNMNRTEENILPNANVGACGFQNAEMELEKQVFFGHNRAFHLNANTRSFY